MNETLQEVNQTALNETLQEANTTILVLIEENVVDVNVITEAVRIGGLFFMSICITLSFGFAAWVIYNRAAPTVKMMQPQFLLMLCFGTTLTSFTIYPMGANDLNTDHINAACLSWPWLSYMGNTITFSALFSKLMRVNEIFHAQGFQRKVVTAKDVLLPFVTLVVINLTLLIIMSVLDPNKWKRVPVSEDDPLNTIGYCDYETWVGNLMVGLLDLVNFVALIILCIQAYRARDIKSDFSEARGVALALFCWLQSSLIVTPTQWILDPTQIDTRYTLNVMQLFVNAMSLLLFIFCPLIAHHRHRVKYGGSQKHTRISGLDLEIGSTAAKRTSADTPQMPGHHRDSAGDQQHHDGRNSPISTTPMQHPNIPEMVLELQALRARVADLQSSIATASQRAEENEAQPIKDREIDEPS
ncbi:Gamma-aminobutyric acid (GABA) B receptor [Seminavis robusta]|uniref:Gamma-aminobutyric acid (GABA) B receptor n=1 Tax=Seminavis robusta TaxID=568900 RepID=A0A9N8EF28_9STRA|nr:Gamma-aminobutyric acid (GABA) B receptor [Seminavis robusta]|eukprot:Sro1088_g240010.1 Gamma-aminobutyric acid (GABA) B receptor (414) ;mRNA; f:20447-21688